MDNPTDRSLADLEADIDASEAEIAAGDLVSGETVLATIQAAIESAEAKRRDVLRRRALRGQ